MKATSSIDLLKNVLKPLGFSFMQCSLGAPPKEFTKVQSPRGNSIFVSSEFPVFPFRSSSARLIANDKLKAYDYAQLNDVSIPKTLLYKNDTAMSEAYDLLSSCGSVIVKPRKGSGSSGLTLDISDQAQLEVAIESARQFHQDVIIQEQFFGEEVRFAVVNGNVEAAILRQKPHIVGDGISTIRQLIEKEDTERSEIENTIIQYPLLKDVLRNTNLLRSERVLGAEEALELGKGTMIRSGASMYNITDQIHSDYINIARKLGSQLGKGFLIVDIMIKDYSKPATESGYVFLEFNLAPALALFYSCRDRKHFNVIEDHLKDMIVELMDGLDVT